MSGDKKTGEPSDLKHRLQEAEETLVAIRRGEVDALVITGPNGEQVFTLKGADHPYRILVEQMNDGAVTLAADKTILYSNRRFAEIVNCPLENVIGRSMEEFVMDRAAFSSLIDNHCRGRRELALRACDGSEVPAALSCAGVEIDDSPCICAIVSDLTEQKQQEALGAEEQRHSEERIRESQRLAAVGKTAAVLAHEIGNPLNGMFTTVQLIERTLARSGGAAAEDQLKTQLQELKAEISRLGALLHEFRSMSSPMHLNRAPMKIADFLPELLQMAAKVCAGQAVEVEHQFSEDLPMVSADREKLKQVFLNLCKNAVEAMPSGGRLCLTGSRRAERVVIEVADTGTGIPPDLEIFELFTTSKSKGTGLGLAVVRQIVSDHGGEIAYTSNAGEGTTFYVSLPILPS